MVSLFVYLNNFSETNGEFYDIYCSCVTSCSAGYTEVNNYCIENFLACPSGQATDIEAETCNSCTALGKFVQDGECVDECFPHYGPDASNVCQICFDNGEYDLEGVCKVNPCTQGYEPDANLICHSCQEL